jgi:hypothetical protein
LAVAVVAASGLLLGCQGGSAESGRPVGVATGPAGTPAASQVLTSDTSAGNGAGKPLRISAIGDTILGDTPNVPSDPKAWLAPIARLLRWKAGIVFGNLEGTLTDATGSKCGSSNGGDCFAFRNPPAFAQAYAATGFTVLNDANNHSHDFGQAGLDQTVRSIHSAGMKQTGLPGEITLVHVHREPVALLAFAPYSNTSDLLDLRTARSMIEKAATEAKVVIVYMHAGAEGTDAQHVTGQEEYYDGEDRGNAEKFAHLAVGAGASLVIASGPHVMRGMQFYRGHLIAYSLGNSVNFHNFGTGGVLSDSGVLHVTLSPTGDFVSARLLPTTLDSDGQARPGGNSVDVVRALSRDDFGAHAARFSQDGTVSPPHHP